MNEKIFADRRRIEELGGCVALSKIIGKSPQCISNWKRRGIPARVKIDNPELFLNNSRRDDKAV